MAQFAAVVLATTELEDDDLLVLRLVEDLGLDAGALHGGRADFHRLAAAEHQHFGEGHCVAGFAGELLHVERLTFGDAVLLTARFDHRVHGLWPSVWGGAVY